MSHPAAQLIDAKGGPAAFAEAINAIATEDRKVSAGAVRMMKTRGRLSRTVWPEIVEAFPDVTLDDLKRIEAAA